MKKWFLILLLCCAGFELQAQYIYKNAELGISADFPCQPQEERESRDEGEGFEDEYIIFCEQKRSIFSVFITKMPVFEATRYNIEQYLLTAKNEIIDGFGDTPILGQQMEVTETSGEMRFRMRSKEINGDFWLQCRSGYLVQIVYLTEEKPDNATWERFSTSFKTDW
ncbi:MAG: hypothetical protein IBJ09_08320 [Bacteroidia bacterium]|nr:hypothetical protein [Bacteroidia bacterium]